MKVPVLFGCVGVGLLGTALLTGCSHMHQRCHCCDQSSACCCAAEEPQPPPPPPRAAPPAKTAEAPVPPPPPAKTVADRPAEGTVVVPFSVTESEGGSTVTRVGTIALTTEQAAAMGVRPGYTPEALYLRNRGPGDLPSMLTRNVPGSSQAGP
jgi:hypothetical protein